MGSDRNVTVLISILNWNTANKTVRCVHTLLPQIVSSHMTFEIAVTDNGSASDDFRRLEASLPAGVTLRRNALNLGFAGGHNGAIQIASDRKFDYIWLLNSDAVLTDPATLRVLVELLEQDRRCAAASPTLATENGVVYFRGGRHDWARRLSSWSTQDDSKTLEETHPEDFWVSGAAMLLRLAALQEVGVLNERFFAYFEDNEICARLTAAGWRCRVAFNVVVQHPIPPDDTTRPPYYFYLMQRNRLFFWSENTPIRYRRPLTKWSLLDEAFFECNKLYFDGHLTRGNASLLGILDFWLNRTGAPDLNRPLPFGLVILRKLILLQQGRALKRRALLKKVAPRS